MQNSIFNWNHKPAVQGEASLKEYLATVAISLQNDDAMLNDILWHASCILKEAPQHAIYDLTLGYKIHFNQCGFATIKRC